MSVRTNECAKLPTSDPPQWATRSISKCPGAGSFQTANDRPGCVFLDQLEEGLGRAARTDGLHHGDIRDSAVRHGNLLYRQGPTIAEVVNAYGDLCQVITGLAVKDHAWVSAAEFQIPNLCVDDATAGAVTSFAEQRERVASDEGTERLGVLAHELRNALATGVLAFAYVKRGSVVVGGSTSAMVDWSHARMQALLDCSLASVRLDAGSLDLKRIPVFEIVEEAATTGRILAHSKRVELAVAPDVEDQCGGLPGGNVETLLNPFGQKGPDRSGICLGLSICVNAATRMRGERRLRDRPGIGCIFTIDLRREPRPAPSSIYTSLRSSE